MARKTRTSRRSSSRSRTMRPAKRRSTRTTRTRRPAMRTKARKTSTKARKMNKTTRFWAFKTTKRRVTKRKNRAMTTYKFANYARANTRAKTRTISRRKAA